jgi:hypothetical protein
MTLARDAFGREIPDPEPQQPATEDDAASLFQGQSTGQKRETATDAIGRRAGALSDELDFPAFVASLVNGTFNAMVDSSIRQMESYAELVAAVAKPLDQFASENVTVNQARDWLVEQYPRDVTLVDGESGMTLAPQARPGAEEGEDPEEPGWLADFGLEGQGFSAELLEEQVLPQARNRVAQQRLQTLATLVLLGLNRIVIRDGSIGARLRFRAAASDHAAVTYAQSQDPGTGGTLWGTRGSAAGDVAVTKVSTVGVNVQADSELKAELFGEVKINFASETLPLERFLNDAQRTLIERHSRNLPARAAAALPAAQPSLPPVAPPQQAAAPQPAPAAAPEPAAPASPVQQART